jgi:hypothetical protein
MTQLIGKKNAEGQKRTRGMAANSPCSAGDQSDAGRDNSKM